MRNPFRHKGGSMPACVPDADSIPVLLSPGGTRDVMLVFHGGPMDGHGIQVPRPAPRIVELNHDSNVAVTYTYERFEFAEDDGNLHYAMTDWKPQNAA